MERMNFKQKETKAAKVFRNQLGSESFWFLRYLLLNRSDLARPVVTPYLSALSVVVRCPVPIRVHSCNSCLHGCFSSQSFWNAGSLRKGSQIGSSPRSAGVMRAGP